ncbi:uncharacterized protein BDV14DRAFT_168444 [Aspergillus stella-maris]|uniref:uncharacterized protein n=1 Tax=Aspergillus stella-maris TaxID=1810926 RepID=UPI003CCD20F6
MSNTVYLVTGTNRGIGLGRVKSLLARPSTTTIASITAGENSTVHIVHLYFSPDTPITTSQILESLTTPIPDVTHIDVLIANAGFAPPMTPALTTTLSDLRAAFEINTIAPLLVFQAFWPLLQRATSGAPKALCMTKGRANTTGSRLWKRSRSTAMIRNG